jgi:hypothetical protein
MNADTTPMASKKMSARKAWAARKPCVESFPALRSKIARDDTKMAPFISEGLEAAILPPAMWPDQALED